MCRVEKTAPSLFYGMGICSIIHSRMFRDVSGGLGGRDLADGSSQDLACACNATYVSTKCCWADDGLVWESELAKLGEIRVDIKE